MLDVVWFEWCARSVSIALPKVRCGTRASEVGGHQGRRGAVHAGSKQGLLHLRRRLQLLLQQRLCRQHAVVAGQLLHNLLVSAWPHWDASHGQRPAGAAQGAARAVGLHPNLVNLCARQPGSGGRGREDEQQQQQQQRRQQQRQQVFSEVQTIKATSCPPNSSQAKYQLMKAGSPLPAGVLYFATVTKRADPSPSSNTLWIFPLP